MVEREADEDLGKSSGYSRITFLGLAGAALAAGIAWSLSQSSSLENRVRCCQRYLLEGPIKLVVWQSVRKVDLRLRQTSLGLAGKIKKRCLFVHDGIFEPRSRKRISAVGCRIDVTGERSVGKRSDLSPSHSCLGVE